MRISDILQKKDRTFSFEFFPPKTEDGFEKLKKTIDKLKGLYPDFISVTYGAGGSTREKTLELTNYIKQDGLEPMAHLTCVGHSVKEIDEILQKLESLKIDNIMALRGDPPKGESTFSPPADGYAHASDLVRHIRHRGHFCIGVAGYPEMHPESENREKDLQYLAYKVDQGASFIITQLFFNNDDYFRFVDEAAGFGIHCKIIPGIMPITNFNQIKRFTDMCGAVIPPKLIEQIEAVEHDSTEVAMVGLEYSMLQCRDLLERGAPGLHFYTLNKSAATRIIYENL